MMAAALRRRAPELAAALAGLAWLLALGGGTALDPRHLDWLGGGDWRQHVLGWLFFRSARWQLPLGAAPHFAWPVGGSAAMTDANPWLALAGKLLSPALPVDFQYLGLWFAISFALQGYLGARLVGLASPAPAHRALGGALFVLSPVLAWRLGHDTLCAQWILLALLFLLLAPAPDSAAGRRSATGAVALAVFAAGVHPYLLAMALVLGAAVLVRHAREGVLCGRGLAARAAALLLGPAAVVIAFGYAPGPPTIAKGFGRFSADLLALVNPMGRARFLPALPVASSEQGEGFAYLGLGGLALLAASVALALLRSAARSAARPDSRFALFRTPRWGAWGERRSLPPAEVELSESAARPETALTRLELRLRERKTAKGESGARSEAAARPPRRRVAFAFGVCGLLGLYSLSQTVTVAGHPIASLYFFYKNFMNVTGPLRASGRFMWPLHQLLLLAGAGGVAALAPRRVATALLALGVAAQAADISPAVDAHFFASRHWRPTAAAWALAAGRYDTVAVYPANVFGVDVGCERGDWAVEHWAGAAYVAYRLGARVNSGYLSRLRGPASSAACALWRAEIHAGVVRAGTIYVVDPAARPELARIASVTCGRLDGLDVCVRSRPSDAFADALAATAPVTGP